jgi:hypothetical protein
MLSAFAGVDAALLNRLEQSGIRSSQACWEAGAVCPERLTAFATWCGSTAWALPQRRRFTTPESFGRGRGGGSAPEMLRRVTLANEASGYYRAKLGEKDMQFCIDFAGVCFGVRNWTRRFSESPAGFFYSPPRPWG